MITIIQGESFPISVRIDFRKSTLSPENAVDVMICVANIKKKHSDLSLKHDEETGKWIFHPTQEETLCAPVGTHKMWVHYKPTEGIVRKIEGPLIKIKESECREML